MSWRAWPSTGRIEEKNRAVPSGLTKGSMSAYWPEKGTTSGADQCPPGRRCELRISARSRVPGHQPWLCDQNARVRVGSKLRRHCQLSGWEMVPGANTSVGGHWGGAVWLPRACAQPVDRKPRARAAASKAMRWDMGGSR